METHLGFVNGFVGLLLGICGIAFLVASYSAKKKKAPKARTWWLAFAGGFSITAGLLGIFYAAFR